MKVLVTGSSGLVGSAIKKISPYYPYDFIFVTSKDADLTDYKQTCRLFEKHHPDYVIHLAACVGGLFKNMNQKVDMFEKNTLINFNVVKYSHDFKVKKLIYASSIYVHSDIGSFYRISKKSSELFVEEYAKKFGIKFTILRFGSVYGPRQNIKNNRIGVFLSIIELLTFHL